MKTILHTEWTVADICKGFTYNELEGKGLFGLDGRLTLMEPNKCLVTRKMLKYRNGVTT